MSIFGMYRRTANGFLAYSDEEKNEIVKKLSEKGRTFNLIDISPTAEEVRKASEIDGKVKTRTVALNYIRLRRL